MQVNKDFKLDWMVNYQNKLPDMLKDGIDVLIYAGDADFICNWYGNKAWTLTLDWSGKDAFNAQEDTAFMVNNAAKGELRSANGFTFFRMYEAGHMTPMDQPEATLQMVNTFIHDGKF
jgi:cathepsin A (carboxypeptidase C)